MMDERLDWLVFPDDFLIERQIAVFGAMLDELTSQIFDNFVEILMTIGRLT